MTIDRDYCLVDLRFTVKELVELEQALDERLTYALSFRSEGPAGESWINQLANIKTRVSHAIKDARKQHGSTHRQAGGRPARAPETLPAQGEPVRERSGQVAGQGESGDQHHDADPVPEQR